MHFFVNGLNAIGTFQLHSLCDMTSFQLVFHYANLEVHFFFLFRIKQGLIRLLKGLSDIEHTLQREILRSRISASSLRCPLVRAFRQWK
jgi:hypothetical protein